MTKHCRIELLGQLRLRVGDSDVTRFRTYKTGALLAYLAYHLGRPSPREELIEMLWPETSPDQSRNSLSQSLSSLRHILEPPGIASGTVLEAGRHTVRLLENSVETDVNEFKELAKIAEQARLRDELPRWDAKGCQAVALFKGEFLPGLYEDWTISLRENLREEVLAILDRLAKARQSSGDLHEALAFALQAVTIDSTREASHQIAIRLYDALGQPDAAVKQFRELERALWTQLGIKPTDASVALVKTSLRRERPVEEAEEIAPNMEFAGTPTWLLLDTIAADYSVPPSSLARPGVIRFGQPGEALRLAREILAQDGKARIVIVTNGTPGSLSPEAANPGQILGDAATAALLPGEWTDLGVFDEGRLFATHDTAGVTAVSKSVPMRLPSGLTRFFGREQEMAEVARWLTDESARIVTLTGSGGMGKTRLSIEVARMVSHQFPRGTALVTLESLSQGEQIWGAVASSLGLASAPNMSQRDQVLAVLEGGRWLLVLDNFEQLCDSGGPEVVDELLQALPELAVLVSSRRKLGLTGERERSLSPLPQADDEMDLAAAIQVPSIALFMDRARLAKPDFQLTEGNHLAVRSLCERLEGVPLALELAAARIQVLSPAQILDRFEQRLDLLTSKSKVERHRSLRNAIDWTYSILDPQLQLSFRQLAVFKGGWYEATAEGVLDSPVTLDTLADLREFSLVNSHEDQGGTVRFQMLETLREFAIQAAPSDELGRSRRSHAEAITALVEDAEPRLEGTEQIEVLNKLQTDRSNIKAAVEWAIENGETDLALRACSASWRFWHLKSHLDEGRDLCDRALLMEGGTAINRARVLNGCGRLAYLQGDYDVAQTHHTAALELGESDPSILAMSKNALGAVAYERGQYGEAVRLFEECLAIRKELDDPFGVGNALSWLGIVLTDQSRYDEARTALRESLELREKIGDISGVARSLNSLGIVARRLGEFNLAVEHYEKALSIQRQMGDRRSISGLLSNLGMVVQALGDRERARSLFEEARLTNIELGDKWGTATALANLAAVSLDLGDLDQARVFNRQALQLRFDMGNQWGIAFSLEGSAHTLIAGGLPTEATMALACSSRIREDMGSPLPPADLALVDASIARAREELGTKFDGVWSHAQKQELASVVGVILRALES